MCPVCSRQDFSIAFPAVTPLEMTSSEVAIWVDYYFHATVPKPYPPRRISPSAVADLGQVEEGAG